MFRSGLFIGVDAIVHCAAQIQVKAKVESDLLGAFRAVNVDGTLALAKQAALEGVRRFVFLSSIKVNGETTAPGEPFKADDVPAPEDGYGASKLEAERGLMQLARETCMEVVIIRPPLVYGPGVKGNFESLVRLVGKGVPLPFGLIRNKRSLVGIDNLVDLVVRCLDHPAAANQVFLAGDGQDLSTAELVGALAVAMEKQPRLLPVPAGVLHLGARLLGKQAVARRLLGSLQLDISKTCKRLGWQPP